MTLLYGLFWGISEATSGRYTELMAAGLSSNQYNSLRYSVQSDSSAPPVSATLSGETLPLELRAQPVLSGALLADMGRPWNLSEYAIPRVPLELEVAPEGWNAPGLPCVLDCCIRLPGGVVHLPKELARVEGIVRRVLGVAAGSDPTYPGAHVYLTTDQRWVEAGQTHRLGGFHIDGLQGARYETPLPLCYAGLVTDVAPTVFAVQPFLTAHLDVARHNIFDDFDRQVKSKNCQTMRTHVVTLMNAYCVHASPVVERSGWRSFVRVEVSHKRFDRLGNTPNKPLSGGWEWTPRPVPVFEQGS